MKNMKKKGFTLVELLVVIAIIAILATVSVVGYTAFITKANQSNAMTEAAQVEGAIRADLMAGKDFVIGTVGETDTPADDATKTTYSVSAKDHKIYKVVETYDAETDKWTAAAAVEVTSDTAIDGAFDKYEDFASLKGTFAVTASGVITYTYAEGVTATIDFN